ncbi:MAG: hypothetical protein FWH02_01000 [Oscillospiraceae bacterium]|nr:hypothetical protein [Oscillospiraceae bacterium]
MNRATSAIMTTAAVGAAMGAAAYLMNTSPRLRSSHTRKIKRNTGKALRQVGDFIGSMSYMMK